TSTSPLTRHHFSRGPPSVSHGNPRPRITMHPSAKVSRMSISASAASLTTSSLKRFCCLHFAPSLTSSPDSKSSGHEYEHHRIAPARLNSAAPFLSDLYAMARRNCKTLGRSWMVAPRRSNSFPPRRSVRGEAAVGESCLKVLFMSRG